MGKSILRLGTGIYTDRYSIQAVVNSAAGRATRRFPHGTDLRVIKLWRKQVQVEHAAIALGARPGAAAATGQPRPAFRRRQTLGQRLEELRKDCGFTYEQLAEQVDLTTANVHANCHDLREPRVTTLKSYAEVFTKALDRPVTVGELEALRKSKKKITKQ